MSGLKSRSKTTDSKNTNSQTNSNGGTNANQNNLTGRKQQALKLIDEFEKSKKPGWFCIAPAGR